MKKGIALLLSVILLVMATACGGNGGSSSEQSQTPSDSSASQDTGEPSSTGKEKLTFWYLWGGNSADIVERIISNYNESQDLYEVEGLSTPDEQKIIVAVSSGAGPDITDNFGNNVVKYASGGIAECLDDYVARDNFDLSVFVENALEMQKYDGKLYALPISVNVYALFYNIDLLEEMGYSEPPATLEELRQICLDATQEENGVVTQLGGMLVPQTYWPYAWANASGTNFGPMDGSELTPDNTGMRDALQFVQELVDITGQDALSNFVTSGNSNWGTAQDPFIAGTQLFRVDGPWYYNTVRNNNPDLNYHIAAFPGSESVGGSGYSLLETSNMFIPTTASNKDGAWDFIKYITSGDGNRVFISEKGDLAPTKDLLTDEDVISAFDHFDVFFNIIDQGKAISIPMFDRTADYNLAVSAAMEAVILGADVETAMNDFLDTVNMF